jgi:hypothetical protein
MEKISMDKATIAYRLSKKLLSSSKYHPTIPKPGESDEDFKERLVNNIVETYNAIYAGLKIN